MIKCKSDETKVRKTITFVSLGIYNLTVNDKFLDPILIYNAYLFSKNKKFCNEETQIRKIMRPLTKAVMLSNVQ